MIPVTTPEYTLLGDLIKIGIPSLVTILVLVFTNRAARKRQEADISSRERLERLKVLQQKKEEILYCLFSYRGIVETFYRLNHQYLSKPNVDYEIVGSEVAKNIPQQVENIVRLNMLTGAYFPELIDCVYELTLRKEILMHDVLDHSNRIKYIPPLEQRQLDRIDKEYEDVHASIRLLTGKIIEIR